MSSLDLEEIFKLNILTVKLLKFKLYYQLIAENYNTNEFHMHIKIDL